MSEHDASSEFEVLRANLSVLELRAGDTVVLSYAGRLSEEKRGWVRELAERVIPGVAVLVLDDGMQLGVIRAQGDTGQRPVPPSNIDMDCLTWRDVSRSRRT